MFKLLRTIMAAVLLFSTVGPIATAAHAAEQQEDTVDSQLSGFQDPLGIADSFSSLASSVGNFVSNAASSTVGRAAAVGVAGLVLAETSVGAAIISGATAVVAGAAAVATATFAVVTSPIVLSIGAGVALGLAMDKYARPWIQEKVDAYRAGKRARAEAERIRAEEEEIMKLALDSIRDQRDRDIADSVSDQGNRLAIGSAFPTSFSGTGVSDEGRLTYSGVRAGSVISGGYTLTDNSGQSASGQYVGNLQRNGQVTGQYAEGAERGSFSGIISANLDRVFDGGSVCEANCD